MQSTPIQMESMWWKARDGHCLSVVKHVEDGMKDTGGYATIVVRQETIDQSSASWLLRDCAGSLDS